MNTKQKTLAGALSLALAAAGLYFSFAATSFDPEALNQPAGYVGMPAVTRANVKDGQQQLFTIDYAAQDWSGNLHSYDIASTGSLSEIENWSGGAQAVLDGQNWDNGRFIVTRSDAAAPAGIPFRWASLSAAQKTLLDDTSAILDYIRGDDTNQMASPTEMKATGNNYRYRAHKLGDIIHSTPMYCSATNCGAATVFVGANDGMLHAFDAATGTERFAYIPSMLLPKLKNLTNPAYTHNYYVDGNLTFDKVGTQTILAGALGAGGKGLFGLDVSAANPGSETAAASKVLWEITPQTAGYAELGHVYGQLMLAKVQTGASTNQSVLLVGNGYNGTGDAALYLINPVTGAQIKKITATGGAADTSGINGLSAPMIWASGTYGTGIYDTAYAGDINGNLWKFDLVAGTAIHLFSAGQAITSAPGLMAHPAGGVMVTFATGRLFTTDDKASTATHYAYGVWDKPSGATPVTDSQLQTQTLTEALYVSETDTLRVRWASNNAMDWATHRGWKTALPISGERLVSDGGYVIDGVYQFVTINPTVNTAVKPYGESWWVQLNALTGGKNGRTLMDLNGDSLFNSLDQITVSSVVHDPVARHMGGGGRSQLVRLATTSLDVYQGNYDKNDWPEVSTSTVATIVSRGVSGGHFDFDIFCNNALAYEDCGSKSGYSGVDWVGNYGNAKAPTNYDGTSSGAIAMRYVHIHEYDDIYDRTGVNMINPSLILDRLQRMVGRNVTRTAGTPTTETGTPITSTVTKMPTGKTKTSTSSTYSWSTTSNFTITSPIVTTVMDDGFPTTSFNTLANGNVEETVVERSTTTSIAVTREYTDGTYYACPSWSSPNRKCYYTFVDGNKTVTPSTRTRVVTYAFTGTLTGFKVLVSNQAYSPAVELTIGGADAQPVKTFNYLTANGLLDSTEVFNSNFPTYTMQTLRNLKFNLPITGFKSKDWGTGVVRAGMHPTVPDCVWGDEAKKGPSGEWRNGALTIQIVAENTTRDDVRLNVANRPELGYVLKASRQSTKLIGEYSVFWHAPIHNVGEPSSPHVNGGWCMGESKNGVVRWSMTPPEDPSSDATERTPATGSSDPRVGSYGTSVEEVGDCAATGACTVLNTETNITSSIVGGKTITTVTVTRNYSDGSSSTTTTTTSVGASTGIGTAQYNRQNVTLGRINWREFQR